MKLTIGDDSRKYPNDHSWGLGIWYYGWDESAIDLTLGYRSVALTWQRKRPAPRSWVARLQRWLTDPTWGFGIYRDPDRKWAVSFGPWLHEFGGGRPERGRAPMRIAYLVVAGLNFAVALIPPILSWSTAINVTVGAYFVLLYFRERPAGEAR
jgi:hypothetical protein